MIAAADFCAELRRRSVGFVTGVPCSYLAGPIDLLDREPGGYVPAAEEGGALAMAAGAELRGVRSAVLIQNSGFGNLVNPLTSLVQVLDLPLLVFMSLRGWPDPAGDEPQHAVMGRAGSALLDALDVPHWTLRPDPDSLTELLDRAEQARARRRPAFILVPKGTVAAADEPDQAGFAPPAFPRTAALRAIIPHLGEDVVVATTGYISRELSSVADRDLNVYLPGSMGHALAVGLGAALNGPDRRVVVIDGDGAAIMHLGTLATVGSQSPANLVHAVLDNRVYGSTGGQRSGSETVRWTELGPALGYRSAVECRNALELDAAFERVSGQDGPHLIAVLIDADRDGAPPRVTELGAPRDLALRFQRAATEGRRSPSNPN